VFALQNITFCCLRSICNRPTWRPRLTRTAPRRAGARPSRYRACRHGRAGRHARPPARYSQPLGRGEPHVAALPSAAEARRGSSLTGWEMHCRACTVPSAPLLFSSIASRPCMRRGASVIMFAKRKHRTRLSSSRGSGYYRVWPCPWSWVQVEDVGLSRSLTSGTFGELQRVTRGHAGTVIAICRRLHAALRTASSPSCCAS
jgi:hypothetical protein